MANIDDLINMHKNIENSLRPIRPIIESPLMKREYERLQQKAYWDKIHEYEKQQNILTNAEIESLLLAIDAGHNLYAELHEKVPRLNSPTLSYYLVNDPQYKYDQPLAALDVIHRKSPYYFQLEKIQSEYIAPYTFDPNDKIGLSVTGENTLLQIKKEMESKELAIQANKIAQESKNISKKAYSMGWIAIIVSIVIGISSIIASVLIAKFL